MSRNILLKRFYPFEKERIWSALIDIEQLRKWNNLHKTGDFKAEVGFKWMAEAKPRMNWDGRMFLEVVEVIPNKKLVYSFKGGTAAGEIILDTLVIWTLTEVDGGTEIQLEQNGFKGMQGYLSSLMMEFGWKKNFLETLYQLLKNESV